MYCFIPRAWEPLSFSWHMTAEMLGKWGSRDRYPCCRTLSVDSALWSKWSRSAAASSVICSPTVHWVAEFTGWDWLEAGSSSTFLWTAATAFSVSLTRGCAIYRWSGTHERCGSLHRSSSVPWVGHLAWTRRILSAREKPDFQASAFWALRQ